MAQPPIPTATAKRVQLRDTTVTGDPVPDNNWNIVYDTGALPGSSPPPPPKCAADEHWDATLNQCVKNVIPPPPPPPVTTGQLKIVAAKSSCVDAAYPPEFAFDGNATTRWRCNGLGSWIQFDLGQASDISEIDIQWHNGDTRAFNYVIETSTDGNSFTSFAKGTSTGKTAAAEKYSGTANARFVKVTVNGNTVNQYASIQEASVFGKGGSVTPPNPVCKAGEHWDAVLNKCMPDVVNTCKSGEHWDVTLQKCVPDIIPPPPPPPPPGTGVDRFGISMIYATRQGTYNNWVQTNANDPRFYEGRVLDAGNGWLKPAGTTQIRIEVLSDTSANEQTIETFDVGKVIAKGYLYKPIDSPDGLGDWGDFEMTWKVRGVAGSGTQNGECHNELVPGGYRQTSDSTMVGKDKAVPAGCEAMSYHFNFYPLSGRVKYEKDSMHTSGYTKSDPEKQGAINKFDNMQEIIQKAILYRTAKGVKLESYVDQTGTGTQFVKVLEFEDTGQWGPTRGGNGPCNCGEYPILSMGRVALGYRGDNWNSFEFTNASIRSIDSGKPLHAATKQAAKHENMIEEVIERSD